MFTNEQQCVKCVKYSENNIEKYWTRCDNTCNVFSETKLALKGKIYRNKFLYTQQHEIVGWHEGFSAYLVNDKYPEPANDKGFGLQIIQEDEILSSLEMQEELELKYQNWKTKHDEYEKQQQEKEDKERLEKEERENLFGFDDGKTPIQKSKILQCLMKPLFFREFEGNKNVTITRKEFVLRCLKNNYITDIKTFSNAYNKRAKTDSKTERVLTSTTENSMYTITKTEYDFANYLLENDLLA